MTSICFCFTAQGGIGDSARDLLEQARSAGHAVVRNAMSPHDRARGYLARTALDTGADWQVWCDADMVVEYQQALHLVSVAEQVGADLMTGVYVCRHLAREGKLATNLAPLVQGPIAFGQGGGPIPIVSCGFGFLAVHRRVFDMVDAPDCEYGKAWFLPMVHHGQHLGEDRSFGVRAHEAGCQLYADTRVLVGHEGTHEWRLEQMAGGAQ